VHNFGPFCSRDAEILLHFDISQSVFSDEVKGLGEFALKHNMKAKVHIHMDTGMGRMGIDYDQALPYLEKTASLAGIEIRGISTTLTEVDFYGEQMKRFLSVCQEAETRGVRLGRRHAASSRAIFTSQSAHLDMVRPGIALYGFFPSGSSRHKDGHILKPVLSLKSRVAMVKTLKPGSTIGYERDFIAKKKERIAVIPVGSTDGYPFNIKQKASVLINGHRFPVISTVTFNHLEVLLDNDTPVNPGDEVVLIGSQREDKITVDEVAGWAGISTYKILAFLNPLLPKYTNSQSS
jgi:alanine racemase